MNDKFDELTKGLAQSVTRRGALKKFGVGLAAMALTSLGLVNNAYADKSGRICKCNKPNYGCPLTMDCSGCALVCEGRPHGGI